MQLWKGFEFNLDIFGGELLIEGYIGSSLIVGLGYKFREIKLIETGIGMQSN